MVRRYFAASLGIVVLALVIGYGVYRASPLGYSATCVIQVAEPPVAATGTDYFTASQTLSAVETALALRGQVYATAAKTAGTDAGTVSSEVSVGPDLDPDLVDITATDHDAGLAARIANSVCQSLVDQVRIQRQALRDTEVEALHQRITTLQQDGQRLGAIPVDGRTVSDRATLAADTQAITIDSSLLGSVLQLPPDVVTVIGLSSGGTQSTGRSLGRDLLVASVLGLLAVFAMILLGEVIQTRQRPG